MRCNIFLKFFNILIPYIEHQNTNYKDVFHVQKAVTMVLYKVAHARRQTEMFENIFGAGKTTVLKYLTLICSALADRNKLYAQFIGVSNDKRLKNIIRGFQRITKLPQI